MSSIQLPYQKYGHPSKFGFKDVINEWKADQWNPEELVSLYKEAGAKYFLLWPITTIILICMIVPTRKSGIRLD
nr:alpha-L-fucosidase [Niabella hibiscisoli]